jgi:hypothetical protein
MVLSVGLVGLLGSTGAVTRMIAQGRRYTEAALLASERLEQLRGDACGAASDGSEVRGAYDVSWQVSPIEGTAARLVTVRVTSPTVRGRRSDSIATVLFCP